jgi:hypothetical protein
MSERAVGGIAIPEGFMWEQPETWPAEFKQLFELTAQLAVLGLSQMDKRMLDVKIDGSDEPLTMLFAIGDRAEELRRAWHSVYALHNDDQGGAL